MAFSLPSLVQKTFSKESYTNDASLGFWGENYHSSLQNSFSNDVSLCFWGEDTRKTFVDHAYVQKSFKYDVFLSFRGEDIRKTFVDHLYHALEKRGVITYKDDEKIQKGEGICEELMRSIEDSKFYIIVFSKNYASSSWCLDELVKIMECQRMTQHTAYPVFYDVEPTDIRKQTGHVKRAFAKHRKEDDVGKWRDALREAADLAGWELKNTVDGHEATFIQEIVNKISLKLLSVNVNVDGNLVGMEDRVKDVVSSLEIGIDKTTLARAVFDQISMDFEGSSFVENIREVSNGSLEGLKSLQKQILSDVLDDDKRISVSGVFDGKNKMKKLLSGRKVLVVLDDVDNIDQLKALAGEPDWFKPGSRIIITTREEQVLIAHRLNFIRKNANCFIRDVNLLSHQEAICLFSRNAFGTHIPNQGYEELCEKVVHYACGLPLTISVLGSFLCDKSVLEWENALERLKTIPLEETMQKLELSYKGLGDDYKEIFLDIACMLKGWRKDDTIRALKSCGFHGEIGLKVLEQKSLITIYKSYGFWVVGMHDHLEEMGKNIVRHSHPKDPHKHSRLWKIEEIKDILDRDLGNEATTCIRLICPKLHPASIMKGLRNMKGLRFLYWKAHAKVFKEFNHVCYDTGFYLSSQCVLDDLQYLNLDGYPLASLPKNFQVNNVVQLQMPRSMITRIRERGERKVLDKLTYIDLSYSFELRTLDLWPTPNLETLILSHCSNLADVQLQSKTPKLKFLDLSYSDHLRIIHLGQSINLEVLSLQGCCDLEELHLPARSIKLKSLNLFYHSKLRAIDLSQILKLEKLHMDGCNNLVELHMPAQLKYVHLKDSRLRILDLAHIRNLEKIKIENCKDMVELMMPVENLELRYLKLVGSNMRTLDLSKTLNLEALHLYNCVHLVDIHMPVSLNLKTLQVYDSKLRTLDFSRTPNLEMLYLNKCDLLVEHQLQSICSLRCLRELTLDGCFLELPEDLHELESLEKLTLSSEKINHLPSSICMLKHLKVLNFSLSFCLDVLPEDLGRLECLEELILPSRN